MIKTTSIWYRLLPPFIRKRFDGRIELQKILTNTGWLVADKIVHILMNLIVGVWVARFLGPELRGIITYSDSFVSLFVPVSALGLGAILIRDLVKEPEAKGELLGTVFIIQLVSYVLILPIIIASVFVLREGELLTQLSVLILAIGYTFATSRVFDFWFQSQLQSKYDVLATRLVEFFTAGLKIILILTGASIIAFVTVISFNIFLQFIIRLFFYIYTGESIRVWRFKFARAKSLIHDSWPLGLSFLAITIYTRIDSVMLGQLVSNEAVGVYGEASRFVILLYFFPTAVTASAYPALVRAYNSLSPKKFSKRFQNFLDILVIVALLVAIPITFLAPYFMTWLYGPAYAGGGIILAILAWTFPLVSLRQGMDRWLMIKNLTRITLWSVLMGIFVNIVLDFLLIPLFGMVGAAWATVIAIATSVYLPSLFIQKLRPLFHQLILALLAPFRIYSLITGR